MQISDDHLQQNINTGQPEMTKYDALGLPESIYCCFGQVLFSNAQIGVYSAFAFTKPPNGHVKQIFYICKSIRILSHTQ